MGYQGFDLHNPPAMTTKAKEFFKKKGANYFKKRYGEYFIMGTQRGASASINISYDK